MYQTRMRSSFLKDFLDPFFFSERFLTDELNGQTIGFGQCFGILPDLFAKRLSELEIVEDPDVVGIQIRSHPLGITKLRQSSYQHDAVVTVKNPVDAIFIF